MVAQMISQETGRIPTDAAVRAAIGVEAAYLAEAFRAIEAAHGSTDAYLERVLGVDPSLVAEVARLVRLTISHQPGPGDRSGEVLSDADLAALGVEPRRYRANSAAIRAEYAHVPDNDFRARRAGVVRTLLSGPAVFYTPLARGRWESQARANLTDELRALEQ